MTDKTLTTQQEKFSINIIAGRACDRGLSAFAASLQALEERTLHVLAEPPELDLGTLHTSAR